MAEFVSVGSCEGVFVSDVTLVPEWDLVGELLIVRSLERVTVEVGLLVCVAGTVPLDSFVAEIEPLRAAVSSDLDREVEMSVVPDRVRDGELVTVTSAE